MRLRFRRSPVALVVTGVLLVAAAPAAAAPPPAPAAVSPFAAAAGPAGQPARAAGKRVEITLVTGDRVAFNTARGASSVTVTAARRSDGSTSGFQAYTRDGDVYVVPDDVLPYLRSGAVDEGLFNVTYLAANGYGDADRSSIPVIMEYPKNTRRAAAPVAGVKVHRQLPSVHGSALDVPKGKSPQFWKGVQNPRVKPADAARQQRLELAGGVSRLWLDRVAHVSLDQSVPLIGAPQAWAAGYDGTGVKVAVLDTGVDRTHPDLAGRIAATADFIGDSDVVDRNGHGTHVASTIAGTGAASQGKYRGVAPGASLLVAKVCSDQGTCPDSAVIAGMQWAVEQGAQVVNISIGGQAPLTYPDPMTRAVDELTAATGTLFVIAAGNKGAADETVESPGIAASALTVAATDKSDQLASFSSRGPLWYEDRSLKPDIAAPGVLITAARSSASSLEGDQYTTASGTSMATPHVSGAAAILVQQHPDWPAARLKAALMSTATDVGRTAFEQGAGRLDVARATAQRVHALTPSVDLGTLDRDQQALSRTVSYANTGSEAVTLSLTAALAATSGAQVPEGAITTDPSVTVPAGGTATATVSVDVPALAVGRYSGALVATDATGHVVLRVPVGFQVEPQSFPVRIEVRGHDGQPCGTTDQYGCNGTGYITYHNLDNGRTDQLVGGDDQIARLTAGHYFLAAPVYWVDRTTRRQQVALVMLDNVNVTGPTTVVLDASKARRITVDTPKPSEETNQEMGFLRYGADGTASDFYLLPKYDFYFWVTPVPKVRQGSLIFQHQRDNVAPLVQMTVKAKSAPRLTPRYSNWTADVPKFSGTQNLELIDLGVVHGLADPASQIPDDLSKVKGKLVLVEQDDDFPEYDGFHWNCVMFDEYIDALAEAGAAGVVSFLRDGCTTDAVFDRPSIPAVTVGPAEGLALRELLRENNRVAIRVTGEPASPYFYHLKFYQVDEVTADQHYTVTDRQLHRIDRDYHAEQPIKIEGGWHQHIPTESVTIQFLFQYSGPSERETFVGPVSQPGQFADNLVFRVRDLGGGNEQALESNVPIPDSFYTLQAGSRSHEEWFGGPGAPGAAEQEPDRSHLLACGACRQGDVFSPLLPMTYPEPQVESTYIEAFQSDNLHLYRDDQEVPPSPVLGLYTGYTLPPEPARYRLTHNLVPLPENLESEFYDRRVSSEWEFTSSRVTEDNKGRAECIGTLAGISDAACAVQPLVYLRYNLNLDLDNSVRRGVHRIRLHAYHEAAANRAPEITSIKAWVSFDGEKTWQVAPTGKVDGGTVTATIPAPPAGARTASLRVQATDADGNRITQTVHEAYGVR